MKHMCLHDGVETFLLCCAVPFTVNKIVVISLDDSYEFVLVSGFNRYLNTTRPPTSLNLLWETRGAIILLSFHDL